MPGFLVEQGPEGGPATVTLDPPQAWPIVPGSRRGGWVVFFRPTRSRIGILGEPHPSGVGWERHR